MLLSYEEGIQNIYKTTCRSLSHYKKNPFISAANHLYKTAQKQSINRQQFLYKAQFFLFFLVVCVPSQSCCSSNSIWAYTVPLRDAFVSGIGFTRSSSAYVRFSSTILGWGRDGGEARAEENIMTEERGVSGGMKHDKKKKIHYKKT